jgi:hypothetical protein
MAYGPYDWDEFDAPRSRFTNKLVFVVDARDPAGGDSVTSAQRDEVVAEARGPGDVVIAPFDAAIGRGASGSALGLLVELGVNVSATALTAAVVAVWKRIRHRKPIMSVGALRYLCLADLLGRLGTDSADDVVTVVACDTSGPRPSELNPVDIEPVLVVFADQLNTRSWVYLVSPRGHILSFHEGEPIMAPATYYSGLPPPPAGYEPPILLAEDTDGT